MLRQHGDWISLGGTDEQKPAPDGSVEAWGRAAGTQQGAGTASRRASAGDSVSYYGDLLASAVPP